MSEFKLTKRMVFEATLIVQAKDGLEAAEKLYAWTPTMWTQREGDSSSEPYIDPEAFGSSWSEDRPVYEVRACRGHFHVTGCGEDLAIPGDPFPTRAQAEGAAQALALRDAVSSLPAADPETREIK